MAVVAVVKVLVWAVGVIGMVVVVEVSVLADVEIIVMGFIVTVLKCALPMPYSVDVPSDLAVDLFMDASAGVMCGVLNGIGIEVLADATANALAVVITSLKLGVLTSLEGFSC